METRDKVKQLLEQLAVESPRVRLLEDAEIGPRIMALVVSPTFEGMDEADRQALVWGKLFDSLDNRDQRSVEFIYTKSPAEYDAIQHSR
jgi:acid stress-induced BolA-like protein IbaG/YrbA